MHELVKKTQFCVNFIALCLQNRSFQTQQSCQLLNRSDHHIWSWILGNDWGTLYQVQAAEIGFLWRVHSLTLSEKMRSCEFRKDLNVEPLLLRMERSQLRWFDRASKDNRGKSCCLHSWESGPEVVQGSDYTSDHCFVTSWDGASKTNWDCSCSSTVAATRSGETTRSEMSKA